jgi:hypothetical protein
VSEKYCPVCRGSKKINLPLTHQLEIEESDHSTMPEAFRTYDCPECGPLRIKTERFKAGKVMTFMDQDQMTTPAAKEWWYKAARETMGRMIAQKMIDEGFIEFERLEPDAYHGEGILASFYGALPKHTEPMEQRIAERQMEVAEEVAAEAKRLIHNWGSYYHWDTIRKDEAAREISAAVTNIKRLRGK